MAVSWRFVIGSSISSTVTHSVKEVGFNSLDISFVKALSQALSLWRMHNLMDASQEHLGVLRRVHIVDTLQMLIRDCTSVFYTPDRNLLTNLKFGTVFLFQENQAFVAQANVANVHGFGYSR